MYTAWRTIWYFIHVNRTLLKIWPNLTFGWPFTNIFLTIRQRHRKLYIFVILKTYRTIWNTWKHVPSIFEFWPQIHPCVTPTGEGAYYPKWPSDMAKSWRGLHSGVDGHSLSREQRANYWFLVIDNRHSAVKYFFHYNHGLNFKNCNYLKTGCPNWVKAYIFGMYTAWRTIWYFIHVNRTLLKIWPNLTFGWPFTNIFLTIRQRHRKLYIFVILKTYRTIWNTWKHVPSIFEFWPQIHPCVTPTGEGAYYPKCCQNIFQHVVTSKPPLTQFRQNVS